MKEKASPLRKEVTARLRELRKAQGITGEQLAEQVGMAAQNLRRMEAGQNLTLDTLYRIAKALGFEVVVDFRPLPEASKKPKTTGRTRRS